MNKNKSKYFYTASLMNQALLELLEKKDIEFITITEITQRAGVNRTTFYLHYDNIDDLLEETISYINKEFVSYFNKNIVSKINTKESAFLITDDQLIPYLNFCKKNKRVLKLVHHKPNLFQCEKAYREMYESIFYPAISQFLSDETEKIFNLEFFTQGVSGVVHKWIELDCKTDIEQIITIIKNCVGFSIKQV